MAMTSIAKFLGKSIAYVHKICTELRGGIFHDSHEEQDSSRKSSPLDKFRMRR